MPESEHKDADLLALGLAVRRMREQRGMSADELANATGMHRQCIGALENGRIDLAYELLLTLADGLGIQLSTLVTLAEQLKESNEP